MNELRIGWYKKFVQTITYIPHFISLVIICGIIVNFVWKQTWYITLPSLLPTITILLILQVGI